MVISHLEISCACLLVMSALAGTTGSPVGDHSGPVGYSDLIAFPRVGRSAPQDPQNGYYYGQKREGKSGLIPFPRVGRSGKQTWLIPPGNPVAAEKKSKTDSGPAGDSELSRPKRQTLIPFPRVGKRDSQGQGQGTRTTRGHMLRLGKRRMLRLGKRAEAGTKRGSSVLRMGKRQTLIPFPRTGKRSGGGFVAPEDHTNNELGQFYVYDEQKEGGGNRSDREEIENGGEIFGYDDIVSLGESSSLLPSFHVNSYRDTSSGLVDMGDYDLYRYDDST